MARDRDGGGLAVRVDRDEKHLILDSNPEVYFTSPTTTGIPGFRSGSRRSGARSSVERLDAWLIQAPKRLAAELSAEPASRASRRFFGPVALDDLLGLPLDDERHEEPEPVPSKSIENVKRVLASPIGSRVPLPIGLTGPSIPRNA